MIGEILYFLHFFEDFAEHFFLAFLPVWLAGSSTWIIWCTSSYTTSRLRGRTWRLKRIDPRMYLVLLWSAWVWSWLSHLWQDGLIR